MTLVKLLDRYVIRKYAVTFLFSILAFIAIFTIVDIIEKIDKFLKSQMALDMVLVFYGYQLPFFTSIALPMSVMLASVFTIGALGKNNELTAIKASGISLYRVSAPILVIGLTMSVVQFVFDNTVVSGANRLRSELESEYFSRHHTQKDQVFSDVMLQESPASNVHLAYFNSKTNKGRDISVHFFDDNRLWKRIDGKEVEYLAELDRWRIGEYRVRLFDKTGTERVYYSRGDSLLRLGFRPADITSFSIKPEDMNYWELKRFTERLRKNRIDPRKWEVNLHFKVSFALTNFIVVLFGIPLAAFKQKQGITFGIGMSLFAIFAYYGLIKFGQVLGFKGLVHPVLSVWIGNIVFLVSGCYLLYKIRQ